MSAINITQAAIALLDADPTVAAILGGRLYSGRADAGVAYPFVVIQEDSRKERVFSDDVVAMTTLRLDIYATSNESSTASDVASSYCDAIEEVLAGARLSWAGGGSSPLVPKDRRDKSTKKKARGGTDAAFIEMTFECRTVRD